MTVAAQSALRRMMEAYSKVTRFIIICNYITRILDPITSRCAKFRFKALPTLSIESRLATMASSEGMNLPTDVNSYLVTLVNGDLRRAITLLQALSMANRSSVAVTKENVEEVACIVPKSFAFDLLKSCSEKFEVISMQVMKAKRLGFATHAILEQLFSVLMESKIEDTLKSEIMIKMAEVDRALIDTADESLQLLDLLCFTSLRIRNNKFSV